MNKLFNALILSIVSVQVSITPHVLSINEKNNGKRPAREITPYEEFEQKNTEQRRAASSNYTASHYSGFALPPASMLNSIAAQEVFQEGSNKRRAFPSHSSQKHTSKSEDKRPAHEVAPLEEFEQEKRPVREATPLEERTRERPEAVHAVNDVTFGNLTSNSTHNFHAEEAPTRSDEPLLNDIFGVAEEDVCLGDSDHNSTATTCGSSDGEDSQYGDGSINDVFDEDVDQDR